MTVAAAFAAGLSLAPGSLAGGGARSLVVFLGLVSASILPTITLLVNSMTSGGRSVQAVNELEAELQAAMDVLFLLFGCVAIVVVALTLLEVPPPAAFVGVPHLTTDVLPRLGQGVVVAMSALTILRIGYIPGILRRSLAIRHKIAVDEARRRTLENAPSAEEVRGAFKAHSEFGRVVHLEDLAK